ncbi:hypothetical protein [Opitutus sp. ER46]|uniref:hypothetical protein n=1 Tax=Opitutus sp. ER46 TaxID=2161864 RepID=UPI0011B256D3|nr:hypothetical protein [Opitutus sp. ER46]
MSPAFLIEAPDATAETQVVLPLSAVRVGVGPRPVFTAWDILNAEVAPLELGTGVSFQLVPTAARELAELSVTARGRRLVFVADGRPLGAVRLGEATAGGRLVMFMEIPDTELPRLVAALQRCR